MNFLGIIESKREGKILAPEQIREFIRAFTAVKISDYQMAATLLAVYFRVLNTAETTALTFAMRDSGDVLKFPKDLRPLVDKHSTGGGGDKVSLPLAPLLAVGSQKRRSSIATWAWTGLRCLVKKWWSVALWPGSTPRVLQTQNQRWRD